MRRPPGAAGQAPAATLLAIALAIALAGCAPAPAMPFTLDEVTSERTAQLEATERRQFDVFIEQSRGRLDELGLPVPSFQGLVALDDIDAIVTQCIVTFNPRLQVARLEGGFTVDYFGTVGETYERIRWTIDSCNAQYGVADLRAATAPGPVEAAWRYHDATQRVLPCLRGVGVVVPTPPSADAFAVGLGTPGEFSPFSLAAVDPAALVRAVALCPPSGAVLQAHLDQSPLGVAPTGTSP